MGTLQRKRIGLWGVRRAGKTSFLATLCRPGVSAKWTFTPLDEATKRFDELQAPRLEKGDFPQPTDNETKRYQYEVAPYRPKGTGRLIIPLQSATLLDVIDPPGDHMVGNETYYGKLAAYDGLLVILSAVRDITDQRGPKHSEVGALRHLLNWLEAQQREKRRRGHPYLAFCLTKCDLDAAAPARDNPTAYFETMIGQSNAALIRRTYDPSHWRVFASSVVGLCSTPAGAVRPNVVRSPDGNMRIAHPDAIQPFGVAEPAEWLLMQVKADRSYDPAREEQERVNATQSKS